MIKPGQSYSILTKSDFVFNLIMGHIYAISEPLNIYKTKAIFGKHIEISDTAVPSKTKVVISRKEREEKEFHTVTVSTSFVDLFSTLLGVDNEEFKDFCKKNIKRSKIEIAYYYMAAIANSCFEGDEFLAVKANTIVNTYSYKGLHSVSDKYSALIDFVSLPNEVHLNELFLTFNDENGGFDSLVSLISLIVENQKVPEFIIQQYGDDLNDPNFLRNLLLICTALLTTKSREEFILYSLVNIIKKD